MRPKSAADAVAPDSTEKPMTAAMPGGEFLQSSTDPYRALPTQSRSGDRQAISEWSAQHRMNLLALADGGKLIERVIEIAVNCGARTKSH